MLSNIKLKLYKFIMCNRVLTVYRDTVKDTLQLDDYLVSSATVNRCILSQ